MTEPLEATFHDMCAIAGCDQMASSITPFCPDRHQPNWAVSTERRSIDWTNGDSYAGKVVEFATRWAADAATADPATSK
jgi:hypothetical protein